MTTILQKSTIETIINSKISPDDYAFFKQSYHKSWNKNDIIYYKI